MLSLLIYSSTPHKEMRLLITIYPFLAILLAQTIISLFSKMNHARLIIFLAMTIWLVLSFTMFSPLLFTLYKPIHPLEHSAELFSDNELIWVSDPRFALNHDKLFGLLYYPFQQVHLPTVLVVDTCNFNGNSPQYTAAIFQRTKNLLKDMNKISFSSVQECKQIIYQKRTETTFLS